MRASDLLDDQVEAERPPRRFLRKLAAALAVTAVVAVSFWYRNALQLEPRAELDNSGYSLFIPQSAWQPDAPTAEVRRHWVQSVSEVDRRFEEQFAASASDPERRASLGLMYSNYELAVGDAQAAYDLLRTTRAELERRGGLPRRKLLASTIFFQGVAGLRLGENENCVMCRGESSCILPLVSAAVHKNREGSQFAVEHLTEYLERFPDDLGVQWLLNVAHMTLGEYPDGVEPRFLLPLEGFLHPPASLGKFRDVGHLVGLNRFNQAGGAIMDDFNNDGLYDVVVSSFDPRQPLSIYAHEGDGRFKDVARDAGVADQLGGMNCSQADFNNDGLLDMYITRGAWLPHPVRQALLRNDGGLHFTDVAQDAGLLYPTNSIAAQWADYDNDGWVDLFVCSEIQPQERNLLFRNLGNGKFEECAAAAGLLADGQSTAKGCAWIDYDNDDYPDLFVNYLGGVSQLYHNNRDGTFSNVTRAAGIDGPEQGFSCWAWDFNNDGWLDIFATCYHRTLANVVRGLLSEPHECKSNKLYLNLQGQGFRDVAREAGLDLVFSTMGSNFGDFDNDGFLDFYLGTGEPNFSTLIPNRMFHNLGGERFEEVTGSAGVGHLQKGHGVACGDWDRDGNTDIFIQMGGIVDGDKYHNVLFQNPGHDRAWISLKLVGQQTNRAAIGARIKVVTDADVPQTICRHVSSGSSFGANPLEQTIGLGDARAIKSLEIYWPTSHTTQVFEDVAVGQALQVTEGAEAFTVRELNRVPLPKAEERASMANR